jgi:tripartite-type tricarboxylate transporter receptor subunit TctC
MGMVASVATRAETTAFIAGEIEKLGPVVKAAGARLE